MVPHLSSTTFCYTCLASPDNVIAQRDLCVLTRDAVTQTSSWEGGQAMPPASAHPSDSERTVRVVSTSFTVPRLSCRTGCSMNAMRSPRGDTRTLLIQPDVL